MSLNYLIMMTVLVCSIGVFIFLLNYGNTDGVFINLKNVLHSHGRDQSIKYLTYNKNTEIKEQIKSMFLKFIMLMNQKNKKDLEECSWITLNLKQKLVENIKKIHVLSFRNIIEVNLINCSDTYIQAEIVTTNLENDNYFFRDTITFLRQRGILILAHINLQYFVKKYEDFQHVTNYINQSSNGETTI